MEGNQPSLKQKTSISKEMTTNDGTEIMTMTSVEMTLSVTVFFFKAAQMPKMKPSGTETIKATMLILMDGAKRYKMMFIAEAE